MGHCGNACSTAALVQSMLGRDSVQLLRQADMSEGQSAYADSPSEVAEVADIQKLKARALGEDVESS